MALLKFFIQFMLFVHQSYTKIWTWKFNAVLDKTQIQYQSVSWIVKGAKAMSESQPEYIYTS